MPPLLVLSNANAGSADETVLDAVLAALREGAEVHSAPTDGPAELARALGEYPEHRPVAVGGDGTLHLLVAALRDRGELANRTVGLVPMGTGNDFARTLGIPDDPVNAAGVVLHGRSRTLDLLTDNAGGVVVNVVHLGIGAQASKDGTPLKAALGPAAYKVGAVLAGLRVRGWELKVVVDGRTVTDGRGRVLQVAIGNGRTIGGGTPLTPGAVPDDGLADVVVSTATGPLSRLRYARLLPDGRHPDHPAVLVVRGREVEVSGPSTPVNSDGELGEPVTRRRWTVRPGAWRITVPSTFGSMIH
ncbi:MAG: diacylglycerol/lipid kinase family protein [Pseudonocardia sp.]